MLGERSNACRQTEADHPLMGIAAFPHRVAQRRNSERSLAYAASTAAARNASGGLRSQSHHHVLRDSSSRTWLFGRFSEQIERGALNGTCQ